MNCPDCGQTHLYPDSLKPMSVNYVDCLQNRVAQAYARIEELELILDERGKRHADKIANKILGFDKEPKL